MDNHVTATECRLAQEKMRPLTPAEMQYCRDAANIRADLFGALLPEHIKAIDGTRLYGVPLRDMSKAELMACVVMLGEKHNQTLAPS